MSARAFVPAGSSDQWSGGETFAPSHVNFAGISAPSEKAGVVSFIAVRVYRRRKPRAIGGGPHYNPGRSGSMPQYDFHCNACNHEFTVSMHIEDREKADIRCPRCGSEQVEQHWAAFAAVTAKKS